MIGTTATITSGAYADAFAAAPHVQVTSVATARTAIPAAAKMTSVTSFPLLHRLRHRRTTHR